MQSFLNTCDTISRRQVNICFAQSQDMPSLGSEKAVSSLVFQFLMWCVMPIITVALNCKHMLNKSEIQCKRANYILCCWEQSILFKSICHFQFKATYPGHILQYPGIFALKRAKTKPFYNAWFYFFQFAAKFALNCYGSIRIHPGLSFYFLFSIMTCFATILPFPANTCHKFFSTMLACMWYWGHSLGNKPVIAAYPGAKLWVLFGFPKWNTEYFKTLFAGKLLMSLLVGRYPAFIAAISFGFMWASYKLLVAYRASTLLCLILCYGVASFATIQAVLSRGGSLKRLTALLASECDRMFVHGKILSCATPSGVPAPRWHHYIPIHIIPQKGTNGALQAIRSI